MTTTFSKNVRLNLAFGNAKGDVTAPDFSKIRNQAKLVLEETKELLEAAYFDHDVVVNFQATPKPSNNEIYSDPNAKVNAMRLIMDSQGDITTVNDGVAHIAGFDGNECLQRVYTSNMSKFIRSEDEVGPALDYYYSRGFPEGQLRVEGEFPQACIKVNETVMWNGKEYPANKFLKNMAVFQEPDFSDMLTSTPLQQVKAIIASSVVEPGKAYIDKENGVAYFHINDLRQFLETSAGFGTTQELANVDGQTESYVPVYHVSDDSYPELNGYWAANVRVFVYSPYNPEVTQLTRID
ncbi:hypothetical protein CPT_Magnus_095 [Klebsiella phage Magnus]|uniref:PAS domain-containing protein n=1 Tax=Klebsiella phage Magnus TaxID=2589660 RepID=A0A5B9N2H1_9CAUD|nr:MazG-like pyrophosphatase [Klebsiella phage Magnus]QEG07974.1 hypothetical protein CPT_Magnus_095 [Klebsiella phage Magnus]